MKETIEIREVDDFFDAPGTARSAALFTRPSSSRSISHLHNCAWHSMSRTDSASVCRVFVLVGLVLCWTRNLRLGAVPRGFLVKVSGFPQGTLQGSDVEGIPGVCGQERLCSDRISALGCFPKCLITFVSKFIGVAMEFKKILFCPNTNLEAQRFLRPSFIECSDHG